MDNKTNTEDVSKSGNPVVRDSLVNTAVQFLQNPNTQSSALQMKKEFLKKKGLTDEEIEIAVQRSGLDQAVHVSTNKDHLVNIPPNYYYPQQVVPFQQSPSRLIWLRDLANTIVALGGAAYLFFWFYKKYVEPYLFGPTKKPAKKDLVEVEIKRLKEGIERVNSNIERLEQKLDYTSNRNQGEEQELITQISTLKGLLLNRRQFPPTPQTTNIPASIPSWQLPETQTAPVEDTKKLEGSPTNSSSNSTNNDGGSDSSLEMIKEQEILSK